MQMARKGQGIGIVDGLQGGFGGEYYSFSNCKNLEKGLQELANHIPNRYMLSFHPQNPHPGFHSVVLQLKDRPNLKVAARTSYWAEGSE